MHISKNVSIKSCHIFKKNKNGHFIFGFFWIRSVQNGSNSQIWWTDISNSWFLVVYKVSCQQDKNTGACNVWMHLQKGFHFIVKTCITYTLQFDHDFIMGQTSLWNTNLLTTLMVCSTVKTLKKIPLLGKGYSLPFLINTLWAFTKAWMKKPVNWKGPPLWNSFRVQTASLLLFLSYSNLLKPNKLFF